MVSTDEWHPLFPCCFLFAYSVRALALIKEPVLLPTGAAQVEHSCLSLLRRRRALREFVSRAIK